MPNSPQGDEDDTTTPVDLAGRKPASPERKAWGTLEAALAELVRRVGALRQSWDVAGPHQRRSLADLAAGEFRAVGDNSHDLARRLEEYALNGE
jgi:hypothetical protein